MAWRAQAQLSTLVLVSLLAFVSIWAALVAMLVWSLAATVVYYAARESGLPDLVTVERPRTSGGIWRFLRQVACSALKIGCIGLQTIVFARVAGIALGRPSEGGSPWRRRLVLAIGLTLFGVTTADHLLRRAGHEGPGLLRRALLGPLLNVPYRIFLSALVLQGALQLVQSACSAGICLA